MTKTTLGHRGAAARHPFGINSEAQFRRAIADLQAGRFGAIV